MAFNHHHRHHNFFVSRLLEMSAGGCRSVSILSFTQAPLICATETVTGFTCQVQESDSLMPTPSPVILINLVIS